METCDRRQRFEPFGGFARVVGLSGWRTILRNGSAGGAMQIEERVVDGVTIPISKALTLGEGDFS